MARTAKKNKKKDPRRIRLFLEYLPTVGDILRYIQNLRSPKTQRFGPLKLLVACPGKSGTTDLVYTAMKECPGRKDRFMTSAITERIDVSVTSPDLEDTGDKKCFII